MYEFTFTEIGVNLEKGPDRAAFQVHINGWVMMTGTEIDFTVSLELVYTSAGWEYAAMGVAMVGSATFMGAITSSPGSDPGDGRNWKINLAWDDQENPINLDQIADSLGFELPPIPMSLDLSLATVHFTFDSIANQFLLMASSSNWGKAVLAAFQQNAQWVFAFNLEIDRQGELGDLPLINLSNIPLLSQVLSPSQTLGVALKVLVTWFSRCHIGFLGQAEIQ
jgi:hypothetical protein